jgi:hypothetical protein
MPTERGKLYNGSTRGTQDFMETVMTVRGTPRVIEVVTTWEAVAGPIPCGCGHEHYGRTDGGMVPKWSWCENESCTCQSLHVRDVLVNPV